MAKADKIQIIPGVSMPEYTAWLNDPVTQAVFTHLEANARPQMLLDGTEATASYRLGIVTGYWSALDAPRTLLQSLPADLLSDPTYEK